MLLTSSQISELNSAIREFDNGNSLSPRLRVHLRKSLSESTYSAVSEASRSIKDGDLWKLQHAANNNQVCKVCHSAYFGRRVPTCSRCTRTDDGQRFRAEILSKTWTAIMADPEQKAKVIKTREQGSLRKFGVRNPAQLESVQQKMQSTCRLRYGHSNPQQNSMIRAQTTATTLARYGTAAAMNNPEIRSEILNRLSNREGRTIANMGQTSKAKANRRKTFLKNYGVAHPLQDPSVFNQVQKTSFSRKEIKVGRRTLLLQGYEPAAFKLLSKIYGRANVFAQNEISTGLPYIFQGKSCVFYPDFQVGSNYFEVKSVYTLLSSLERNRAKARQSNTRFLVLWKSRTRYSYLLLPEN